MGTQNKPGRKKDKGHPRIITGTKLVDRESPMLYTKTQPLGFFWFWRRRFLNVFYHIGMAAILFNGAEPFRQIDDYLRQKAFCEIDKLMITFDRRPYVKAGENLSNCFREETI